MIKILEIMARRHGWLRGLKFKKYNTKGQRIDKFLEDCLWNTARYKIDRVLRAFLWASIVEFPDLEWVMTDGARWPVNDRSGHNWPILSAVDLRSKSWTFEQMVEYKNWAEYWWGDFKYKGMTIPGLIDVVIEDGRYNEKYIVYDDNGKRLPIEQQPWHFHIEKDKPFWKEI